MTLRLQLFAALVALQVALPVATVVWNEAKLATGTEVRLRTVPVDPRDFFRGDYVVLRYEISSVQTDFPLEHGETAYVRLRKVGPRYKAYVATAERPDEMPFIRGRVTHFDGGNFTAGLEYGIETYYVQEGTGRRYENARFLYVDVKLDRDGTARIERVTIPRST